MSSNIQIKPLPSYTILPTPQIDAKSGLVAFDEKVIDFLTLHSAHMPEETTEPRNVLRDTLLRYLGYANEFTEAGKAAGLSIAKALNPFAWLTVFTYGISDALNRSIDIHTKVLNKSHNERDAKAQAISGFGRDILFHSIATWYGPVYAVIKPVAKLTEYVLKEKLKKEPKAWPAIVSLMTIPFVPKLFDPITDKFLEIVYTPISNALIHKYLNNQRQFLAAKHSE